MSVFDLFSGNYDMGTWLMQLLYRLPAVLLALSAHECAHAWAAYKAGDPTARNLGRLTLDPTKHLDPVGFICLLFFRFGWAKPVPINPRNFRHYRRDNILVSLAGIFTNFILSFICAGIYYAVWVGAGFQNEIFYYIMMNLIVINITLGIFNLIPIPPLDGSHVLGAFLRGKVAIAYNSIQRYGFIILIVLLITGVLGNALLGFTNWLLGAYDSFFSLFFG